MKGRVALFILILAAPSIVRASTDVTLGAPASPPKALSQPPIPVTPPVWSVPVLHTAGVMVGMRLGLSILWPDAYDPLPLHRSGHQYARAFSGPPDFRSDRRLLESDGDPWTINVIGHGLFGAELYGRVRACGGAAWQALAFAAAGSVVWEYGIEAFNKRPSAIDLALTPLIGAFLGEGRYQLLRYLRERPPTGWRRTFEFLVDPLGETERSALRTRC